MSRKRDDRSSAGAERLSDALSRVMTTRGYSERVKQTQVLSEWKTLVGPEIASVSRAESIGPDGTLFAVARTSAWLNELTMMEADLLASINRVTGSKPIQRIRWSLMR